MIETDRGWFWDNKIQTLAKCDLIHCNGYLKFVYAFCLALKSDLNLQQTTLKAANDYNRSWLEHPVWT
jgi:hypothetical protein